jgi:hypothetical protein
VRRTGQRLLLHDHPKRIGAETEQLELGGSQLERDRTRSPESSAADVQSGLVVDDQLRGLVYI